MMNAEKDKEKKPFFIEIKNNYGTTATKSPIPTTTQADVTTATVSNIKSSTVYYIHGSHHPTVKVGHCHRDRMEGIDKKARKKLIIASILCLLFMIAEIIGGILSNSLAIATDAAHLLTDFAAFMISLFALWLAGRPSTQRLSFGWYRAEVIGALVSVLLIWGITAILIWLAVNRIINKDYELEADIMLITSGLAIVSNVIMGWQLHHGHGHSHGGGGHGSDGDNYNHKATGKQLSITNSNVNSTVTATATTAGTEQSTPTVETTDFSTTETVTADTPNNNDDTQEKQQQQHQTEHQQSQQQSEQRHNGHVNFEISENSENNKISITKHSKMSTENINVRAAFIHVVGDVVQSIGVFVAALIIYFKPEWAIVDPICTFIFSIIVLFTTFKILKDAILVLMEATPDYLHYAEVMNIFLQIDGVERVHNLRIWALSINKCALSAHLAIRPGANPRKILQDANTAVHLRYNFFETTIQIEDFTPEMEECKQCTIPASNWLLEKVENMGFENIIATHPSAVSQLSSGIASRSASPMAQLTSLKNLHPFSQQQLATSGSEDIQFYHNQLKYRLNTNIPSDLSDDSGTSSLSSMNSSCNFSSNNSGDKSRTTNQTLQQQENAQTSSVRTSTSAQNQRNNVDETTSAATATAAAAAAASDIRIKQMQRQKSRRNLKNGIGGQRPDLGTVGGRIRPDLGVVDTSTTSDKFGAGRERKTTTTTTSDQTSSSSLSGSGSTSAEGTVTQSLTQSFVGSISSLFFGRKGGWL